MAERGLLFDLDGTIWDSHGCYSKALHDSGEGLDMDLARTKLRQGENIVSLARRVNISNARFRELCAECSDQIVIFPGVRETLDQLEGRGIAMGVVTNLPEWLIEPILEKIELKRYFPQRVYAARKPSGIRLRAAADNLGVASTTNIHYVGDTESDAIASARAGVLFAWASYGYGAVQPRNTAIVLRHFPDVIEL